MGGGCQVEERNDILSGRFGSGGANLSFRVTGRHELSRDFHVDGTENTRLKICYLRKATDPERIPVNFDLGRDYIIILNNAISASAIDFTSGTPEQPGERELDLAYLIADSFFDPYFYPRRRDAKSGHKNEPWRLFSVNKNSALYRVNAERAEIERWAKERALELEGEK
jgi:hypothetical protein